MFHLAKTYFLFNVFLNLLLLFEIFFFYTLKMCSLLKIESNSSSVNFTHFREKTHLLALELIFDSSNRAIYMYIKLDIWNERLKWYKKRSIFAKWAIQNNSDAFATTHGKWKRLINSSWVILVFSLYVCCC